MSNDPLKPPVRTRTRPKEVPEAENPCGPQEPGYQVGYGKPPLASRFRPGRSGNPAGRPKGAKNYNTVMDDVLSEKIAVTFRGKTRKITAWEGAFRRQVQKALDGDSKAFLALERQILKAEARKASDPAPGEPEVAEASILDIFMDIAREASSGKKSGEDGA
ncbi:MAG TPA: DUF5681 domain-containing protein [Sphingomicrobium sp.]|jgi:hypothetical protein|nr:DUF5681 domain-containing protein [Sphingomicrobium sp.]